jgi:cobalt-zinc-cadmium efflux system membrane fusion protein
MVDVFMGTDSADLYRKIRHSTARLGAFAVAVAIGIAVASLVPKLSDAVRTALGLVSGASVAILSEQEAEGDAGKRKPEASGNELPAVVKLTDDQIGTAGIELAPVQDGTLTHQIIVPGTIVPHADRIARVSVRLPAMVAELRKRLGEHVDKGLLLRRKEAVA